MPPNGKVEFDKTAFADHSTSASTLYIVANFMEKGRALSLDSLPDELSMYLLGFLTVRDWCRLSTVSRHFFRVASDQALWKRRAHVVKSLGPTSRVCHSSVTCKGEMFVYGGHNPSPGSNFIADVKNELFIYNIEKMEWSQITTQQSFPFRTEHCAVLWEDRMYVLGGYAGLGGYQSDTFYFDLTKPRDEPWEPVVLEVKGDAPPDRSAFTAVNWRHYIFVFGGWDGVDTMNDFYRLDLKKRKWKRVKSKGDRPTPRRSHNAFVFNNSMYVLLGYDGTANCEPDLFRYDFESKRWEIEVVPGPRPPARSRAKCVRYLNTVAIFGGWDRVNYFEDWYEFNLERRTWTQVEVEFPSRGIGQHTADVYENRVYVFGGFHAGKNMSAGDLWIYSLGHLGRLGGEA